MSKNKGISKTVIILVCVIIILSLAWIERQFEIRRLNKEIEFFKESFTFFYEEGKKYMVETAKLNEMISRLNIQIPLIKSIQNNLTDETNFLKTAPKQEIINKYDLNEQNIGGN